MALKKVVNKGLAVSVGFLLTLSVLYAYPVERPIYAQLSSNECTNPSTHRPVTLNPNPVNNGNFATAPDSTQVSPVGHPGYDNTVPGFLYANSYYSQTANVGNYTYPVDFFNPGLGWRTMHSVQDGDFIRDTDSNGNPIDNVELNQLAFPGDTRGTADTSDDVPASSTWLYTNGNGYAVNSPSRIEYVNWGQEVSGLDIGREYVFVLYISNVVEPPADYEDDPVITIKRGGNPGLPDGNPINLVSEVIDEVSSQNSGPNNGWIRVAFPFTPLASSEVFKITDSSGGRVGDDFAMTAISIQICEPFPSAPQRPYMRTYGNDVIAGGGFGSSCPSPNNEDVRGFGRFGSSPNNHASYVGGGSELGVFAPGGIQGFLPGVMNVGRNRLDELSFANDPPNVGGSEPEPNFSGGFGMQTCADAFPDTTGYVELDSGDSGSNISTLLSSYYPAPASSAQAYFVYNAGDTFILNGGEVPRGVDFRIVVNGAPSPKLVITNDITYYQGGASWGSIDDIPTASFYSEGDLFIDHSVEMLNGIFNARGLAHTCSDGATDVPLSNIAFYTGSCRGKLTLHGSLTANDVRFYRLNGDLPAGVVGEGYTSNNLAEAFVFSPDIYLGLLANQSTTNVGTRVDAIRTLPPAL